MNAMAPKATSEVVVAATRSSDERAAERSALQARPDLFILQREFVQRQHESLQQCAIFQREESGPDGPDQNQQDRCFFLRRRETSRRSLALCLRCRRTRSRCRSIMALPAEEDLSTYSITYVDTIDDKRLEVADFLAAFPRRNHCSITNTDRGSAGPHAGRVQQEARRRARQALSGLRAAMVLRSVSASPSQEEPASRPHASASGAAAAAVTRARTVE